MTSINTPDNVSEYQAPTISMPLSSDSVPWPLKPPTNSEGLAFWYRPATVVPMPQRSYAVQQRPGGTLATDARKHRRTRNGCLTCRGRRVKCDEARPKCDRCRKGGRPCEFPPPIKPVKRKPRRPSVQVNSRAATQSPVAEDEDELDAASEDSQREVQRRSTTAESPSHGTSGETAEIEDDATAISISPRLAGGSNMAFSADEWESVSASGTTMSPLRSQFFQTSSNVGEPDQIKRLSRWAHLPPDLQQCLQYQQESMTFYHYFFKADNNDFIHHEFIDLALQSEALLYAAVGFAAYHRTLERDDGRLEDFLGYYGKAVSLLRSSLEAGCQRTISTFLTILQLATFEEYLGDWVHLSAHHRAAHHLLLELYTPQTVMNTEIGRQIFAWYSRFDVIAGLMAGSETALGREWYVKYEAHYEDQLELEDIGVEERLAAASAVTRVIGMDMAMLFAQLPQGVVNLKEFTERGDMLAERISQLRRRIERLNDGDYTVNEFPAARPLGPDDIVDPYKPGGLFQGVYWPLNYLWIDWYALYQMHTLQMMTVLQHAIPPKMKDFSLDQCRILETIEKWPHSPRGSLLGAHASLTIAAIFLRKDEKHTLWCRRKLATMEQQGYVFPPTFRKRMAEIWQIADVHHWWLPHDEGFSSLLRDIRAFSDQRTSAHTDQSSEKLREISAVFSGLNLREQ